eukprot:TRINITY_DN498_c0_g1_i1.p1 TRINITY_DN498_c0_g1~~TRINITY_DN498_c0_g1_i1.p1  ORF type:complete len:446 (+),score=99.96 TRINITY_DN498_c0_g1_i1:105-1442(+)
MALQVDTRCAGTPPLAAQPSPVLSPKGLPDRYQLNSINSSVCSPAIVLSFCGDTSVTAALSNRDSLGGFGMALDNSVLLCGGIDTDDRPDDRSSGDLSDGELGTGAGKSKLSDQGADSPLKRRPTASPSSAAAQRRESVGPNTVQVSIEELLKWKLVDSVAKDGAMVVALRKEDLKDAPPPDVFGVKRPSLADSSEDDVKEEPAIIPRLSRITKINAHYVHCKDHVDDWLSANTQRPRSDLALVQYALPQKSLELLLRDGRELSQNWKSRMDWVRGMWCDKSGKRLYEVEGFSVAVRCDVLTNTIGDECGPRKQILPFNDQIWLEDLWLNLPDSTKSVLKWQRSGGRTQIWRRPRESDLCFRRWKKHNKQGDADPAVSPGEQIPLIPKKLAPLPTEVKAHAAAAAGPPQREMQQKQPLPSQRQGRFARMLRGLCCGSAADVAQDC